MGPSERLPEGPVYEALEDTAYSPDAYPTHWELAQV